MPALTHPASAPSLLLFHSTRHLPTSSKPLIPLLSKPLRKPSFSLYSTPLAHSSSPSNLIFLNQPLHQELEPDQEGVYANEDDVGNTEEDEDVEPPTDPLLKFSNSCASEFETDMTIQSTEVGPAKRSVSRPLPEGVVGEILKIATELPENVRIGERLDGFERKVSEKECLDVLGCMGEEEEEGGMVRCCLYFYEWMRLQEPSLVTPCTCTVLFPILGKAGMADELMDLFGNLLDNKEFHDVQVYNAAISGLLSCGRYKDYLIL